MFYSEIHKYFIQLISVTFEVYHSFLSAKGFSNLNVASSPSTFSLVLLSLYLYLTHVPLSSEVSVHYLKGSMISNSYPSYSAKTNVQTSTGLSFASQKILLNPLSSPFIWYALLQPHSFFFIAAIIVDGILHLMTSVFITHPYY